MLRSIAIVAVLAWAPAPGEAKCALMGLAPAVLTPPDSAVPLDGGVVVGVVDVPGELLASGNAAVQAGWRLRIDGALHAPKIETLAPGLAVYRSPVKATRAQLEDGGKAVLAKVSFGQDKPLALAAPKVKAITHRAGKGRRPFAQIEVELGEAVPPGAIAIVLADAKGAPRSWGRVEAGKGTAVAFDRSRCRVLANGTVESAPGDKVTVFWVDRGGRRSPAAGVAVIAGVATPGADD